MFQIKCTNVALGYEKKVIAKNLSFSVSEGDYLCIVGENGAGKSTLLKTLLGLQKPISGELLFSGASRLKGVGYLPQQTAFQKDFPATVREIVLSGFLGQSGHKIWFSKAEKNIADENLKKLGIFDLKKTSYRNLSGGQQQRVLLARAMCAAKKLIILDEPAAGLDPVATNEMYHMLMDLNKAEGITVVMVSHDINAALHHAKHILHLGNREVFFGTVEEYKNSETGRAFLNSGKCRRCEE